MKKAKINALINLCLIIVFVLVFISGITLWVVLPEGRGQSRQNFARGDSHEFLGVSRGNWKNFHLGCTLTFTGLTLTHLVLHLNYLKRLGSLLKG